jgi:hypothetical protein
MNVLIVSIGCECPLDCYDAKIAPEPTQVSVPAKAVEDCRFVKEQDERLNCFIGL